MNHFNLRAALNLKFLIFYVHTQACRQGGGISANAPPTGQKGPPGKSQTEMNLRKKNAKDESFLLILSTHATFHSVEKRPEVVDHL